MIRDWCSCITSEKNKKMESQVGKTKDVGFQYGIRKTFPVSSEKAWDFLFSVLRSLQISKSESWSLTNTL